MADTNPDINGYQKASFFVDALIERLNNNAREIGERKPNGEGGKLAMYRIPDNIERMVLFILVVLFQIVHL